MKGSSQNLHTCTPKRPFTQLFFGILCILLTNGCCADDSETASHNEPFEPHARLANLGNSEAIDLGAYNCESRAPAINCETIFDYSRINYDPYNHRMLVFGGGHAATGRTDVDSFDMKELSWGSLYQSMSCNQVASGKIDPRGFHSDTGHPVARHSYDQNVITEHNGAGRLVMFSTESFKGHCHNYRSKISAVASLSLTDKDPKWSFTPERPMPWRYAGSAEFDPVSGMVILMNGQSRGMLVYDSRNDEIVATIGGFERASTSSNLIYSPLDDRMYLLDRKTLEVRAYTLDRDSWVNTIESVVSAPRKSANELRNFAYDSRNHIIGGIQNGLFHAFDIVSHSWKTHSIASRSNGNKKLNTVRHHAIDYDPINNVFIVVSGKPGSLRTWAYRYRN